MTKHLMICNPYTVVAVPFPFTDLPQTKKRPAVVVSSEQYQNKTGHITLLMITTAKHSHWYNDYAIADLASAGLSVPSIIRQKLFTLDKRLIIKELGILSKEDRKAVSHLLQQHICL